MDKRILFKLLFLLFLFSISIFPFLRKTSEPPDLTVLGFIQMGDGLGRQSAELLDIFRNELKVNFVPTRKEKGAKIPKRFQNIIQTKDVKWGKVIIFEDMLWRPHKELYKKMLLSDPEQSIRIAYSLWESTQIPYEWVHILNEHFDAVVVPSPFLVEVYEKSGITIPIFEVPLGLNLQNFTAQPIKAKKGEPFVFGNLSACSERKNQLLLIRAFAKAFGNNPDVLLRINSRYGEKKVSNSITREIIKLNLNNVVFTQFELSQEEYLKLFNTIDCYVSPSKGEGFSIQPREAMALGIPVIAADNTGQSVICESGLVRSLSSPNREIAVFPSGDCYGYYYNCDEEELADAMREVRENYSSYLTRANDSRMWAKKYQYENLQSVYRAFIKPENIQFGEENKIMENCLVTSSKTLYEKCSRIFSKH